MTGLIIAIVVIAGIFAWVAYELKHAPTIEDDSIFEKEHEEAIKAREPSKDS